VHTLHFRCRNDLGEVEDLSVELSTQDDIDRFVVHADLFSASKTTTYEEARGSDSLTLSEALAVAADPTVYLTLKTE